MLAPSATPTPTGLTPRHPEALDPTGSLVAKLEKLSPGRVCLDTEVLGPLPLPLPLPLPVPPLPWLCPCPRLASRWSKTQLAGNPGRSIFLAPSLVRPDD